jgi:hypothetical protein
VRLLVTTAQTRTRRVTSTGAGHLEPYSLRSAARRRRDRCGQNKKVSAEVRSVWVGTVCEEVSGERLCQLRRRDARWAEVLPGLRGRRWPRRPARPVGRSGGRSFCGECGTSLAAVTSRVASISGSRGQGGPVAERRVTSVLFGDLVGFTPLSESRDTEDVRELLSRYFAQCRLVIGRYGGVVDKFKGARS